jgi:hypothetical protein
MAREKVHPELQDGMSAYGSLAAAREIWQELKQIAESRGQEVRAGYYIARVNLRPGHGFALEDLGEVDEHVTIWGDPHALAGAVSEIYPASTEED